MGLRTLSANTVQRAFELADAGSCRTVDDIRRTLHKERMDQIEGHLGGGSLKAQLRARMKVAHAAKT